MVFMGAINWLPSDQWRGPAPISQEELDTLINQAKDGYLTVFLTGRSSTRRENGELPRDPTTFDAAVLNKLVQQLTPEEQSLIIVASNDMAYVHNLGTGEVYVDERLTPTDKRMIETEVNNVVPQREGFKIFSAGKRLNQTRYKK